MYGHGAVACALLVFPALIFLGWWDAAVGSVVPLIMLAVILSALENSDPDYRPAPPLAGRAALVLGGGGALPEAAARLLLRQGARVVRASPAAPRAGNVSDTDAEGLAWLPLRLDEEASVAGFAAALAPLLQAEQLAALDVLIVAPPAAENAVLDAALRCAHDGAGAAQPVETPAAAARLERLIKSLQPFLASNATVLVAGGTRFRGSCCVKRGAHSRTPALMRQLAAEKPSVRWHAVLVGSVHTERMQDAGERLARLVHYPAFFAPGTRLFDSFSLFWAQALTRSPDRVAMQFMYGILEDNQLENGCTYFGEKCLRHEPQASVEGNKDEL